MSRVNELGHVRLEASTGHHTVIMQMARRDDDSDSAG